MPAARVRSTRALFAGLAIAVLVVVAAGVLFFGRNTDSEDGDRAAPAGEVVLEAEGLGFVQGDSGSSIAHLPFGTDRADVLRSLAASVGEPSEVSEVEECPFGPAVVADFTTGLSVTFGDGELVGWSVQAPSTHTTAAGIGAGSSLAEVKDVYAGTTVEATSLGWEFTAGEIYGVVSGSDPDDEVLHLFGGDNCIFR